MFLKNNKKEEYTRDMVPIKEIKDGIIITDDDRYLKILEVDPINFHLRSEDEKSEIIYQFASWFKIAPVNIHFKVVSENTNLNNHILALSDGIKKEKNVKCKELQRDYMKLICDIGLREGVMRKFYLILEYEKKGLLSSDYSNILTSLKNAEIQAVSKLKACGNKVIVHDDEDLFLTELFYNLFNRNSSELLPDRVKNIMNFKAAHGVDEEFDVKDILAPYSIEKDTEYLLVNNSMYYSFLYIPGNSYKVGVTAGWMSGLINMGKGIDVDLFFTKKNKSKQLNSIGRKIRLGKAKLKDTTDSNTDYDEALSGINAGYFLKNGLVNGNEDFYEMSTLITVSAYSIEELSYKVDFIKESLKSQDMNATIAKFHMIDAFKSALPICQLDKYIQERSARNVLTYGAASTYIFTSFEMSDDNGIMLGINEQNNSLCILDLFDSEKYKNANMSILGTSGAGKTFLMQTMALRMRMKDIQTFIIAPLKGHEFKRACTSIGGEFIKLSPGSTTSINILEIRPSDSINNELIDGDYVVNNESILAKKIQDLSGFFTLVIPDMNSEEKNLLNMALAKIYADKGITYDNDSLILNGTVNKDNPNLPVYKEMPLLGDLYNELIKSPDTKRMANILSRLVSGNLYSFNHHTNVNLNNRYIVVDISEFSDELLPIGMFVALDFIYAKAKEDRTKKKAIFIDETWRLIGAKSNEFAANYVLEIFKIIRGYGGAAIAATQDINDFFALDNGYYGRGVISNSKTKIILNLESKEAERVQDIFDLSNREVKDISRFERGHGLIITNTNNVPVEFKASPKERDLITTDRKDLERIAKERQF